MIPPKRTTWVLIADGTRARVLEHQTRHRGLTAVPALDMEHPLPRTADIGADRPARSSDSTHSGMRNAVETTDWHRHEKETFAREIAHLLDQAAARGAYDKLVLVAPPDTLGDLRTNLDGQTRKRILAEIDKDLTKHRLDELPPYLDDILRPL